MTSFTETLNHWGDQFLHFAWPMLWQSTLLIAIIFVLDFALRRKIRASIRYALWLMVLVKLLLPPSLALPTSLAWWLLPIPQSPAKQQTTAFVVAYADQIAPTFPLQSQPTPAPIQPKMSVTAWTLVASVAVSAGLLAWLLFRWLQINQKVRHAKTSQKLIPILDETRRLTRLGPDIRLKLTEDSMSPAVCGLFRPVILLPQSLVEKLSAGQLRAVLLHEAIHLRRGDVWVNCAQALLQIFYWWHPLLWLANARIRRLREEAVDDAVMLALRDDAEIYAPTLLEVAKLAFNRPLASLGLVGILESRSALRQRIERLINFQAPRKAGLTLVSILGILVFTAVALPMGEAPEKTNEPTIAASNLTAFRAVLHALEQRTGVETLAEPEVVSTSGIQAQRMRTDYVLEQTQYASVTGLDISSAKLETFKIDRPMKENDLKKLLLDAGVKIPPTVFIYMDDGILLVRGSEEQLNLVEQVICKLNGIWPKADIRLPAPNSYVTNNDVHTSPGREMIYRKLDSLRLESVPWSDGRPLGEVIRYLAEQSRLLDPDKKGINFVFVPTIAASAVTAGAAPESVDPSAINVKLMLNNASLHDVLDAVVRGADHPIKYSIEDYAVVFSAKPSGSEPPILEMRVFKVDPNTFIAGLRNIPGLRTNNVATMAESLFSKLGVDLTAPGRSIAFNGPLSFAFKDKSGLLFVKATPSELDTVERVIEAVNQIPPQIHIKARFIEVPKDGFVMPTTLSNNVAGQMTGILTDPNFRVVIHALEKRDGVETLAEPEAVTTSGRQTQMRATVIENILTNYALQETSSKPAVVPQIAKLEIGPTVDVVPYVLADGYTIDLTTIVSQLEFLGYDQVTNEVFGTNSIGWKIHWPKVSPGFRVQKAVAHVNLWDNQTLVLGNLKSDFVGGDGQIHNESKFLQDTEKKNGTADKELLVFITASIVDTAGNRVHSDDELRQLQEKTKSYSPPQPKFPIPSP